MIAFLTIVATVGCLASVLRLVVAVMDYRRRWSRLPAERVFGQPARKAR